MERLSEVPLLKGTRGRALGERKRRPKGHNRYVIDSVHMRTHKYHHHHLRVHTVTRARLAAAAGPHPSHHDGNHPTRACPCPKPSNAASAPGPAHPRPAAAKLEIPEPLRPGRHPRAQPGPRGLGRRFLSPLLPSSSHLRCGVLSGRGLGRFLPLSWSRRATTSWRGGFDSMLTPFHLE